MEKLKELEKIVQKLNLFDQNMDDKTFTSTKSDYYNFQNNKRQAESLIKQLSDFANKLRTTNDYPDKKIVLKEIQLKIQKYQPIMNSAILRSMEIKK